MKLDIIKELQDLKYQEDEYKSFRDALTGTAILNINLLDEDNFRVRMELKFVHKYKEEHEWMSLETLSVNEIKEHLSSLITPLNEDEFAKRFDIAMYIQYSLQSFKMGMQQSPLRV